MLCDRIKELANDYLHLLTDVMNHMGLKTLSVSLTSDKLPKAMGILSIQFNMDSGWNCFYFSLPISRDK